MDQKQAEAWIRSQTYDHIQDTIYYYYERNDTEGLRQYLVKLIDKHGDKSWLTEFVLEVLERKLPKQAEWVEKMLLIS